MGIGQETEVPPNTNTLMEGGPSYVGLTGKGIREKEKKGNRPNSLKKKSQWRNFLNTGQKRIASKRQRARTEGEKGVAKYGQQFRPNRSGGDGAIKKIVRESGNGKAEVIKGPNETTLRIVEACPGYLTISEEEKRWEWPLRRRKNTEKKRKYLTVTEKLRHKGVNCRHRRGGEGETNQLKKK